MLFIKSTVVKVLIRAGTVAKASPDNIVVALRLRLEDDRFVSRTSLTSFYQRIWYEISVVLEVQG